MRSEYNSFRSFPHTWNVVLATTRKQKEIIIKNYYALNKLKEKQATRKIKPSHGVSYTTTFPNTKITEQCHIF